MKRSYAGEQITTLPDPTSDLHLVPASPQGPCSRCQSFEKELIAKDRLVEDLRRKLDAIHAMSAPRMRCDGEATMLKVTDISDSDSNDSVDSGHSIQDLNHEERSSPAGLQDLKTLGGEEVRFTVQEIIDKVIDGSPKKQYIFETNTRNSEYYNDFIRRLELQLEALGTSNEEHNMPGQKEMPRTRNNVYVLPKKERVKPGVKAVKKSLNFLPVTQSPAYLPNVTLPSGTFVRKLWKNGNVDQSNFEDFVGVSNEPASWRKFKSLKPYDKVLQQNQIGNNSATCNESRSNILSSTAATDILKLLK